MPPRIPIAACLRASKAPNPSPQFTLPLRTLTTTPTLLAKSGSKPSKKKPGSHDPYLVAQRNRKKAANLSRRAELEQARVNNLGDPIRGNSTPFVESFATAAPVKHTEDKQVPRDTKHLNYALEPHVVAEQLEASKKLAVPLAQLERRDQNLAPITPLSGLMSYPRRRQGEAAKEEVSEDPEVRKEKDHARATEAIARITALEHGSSKDRMRVNIARCVETFGRHNTDTVFPPRAPPLPSVNSSQPHPVRPKTNVEEAKKRIGPDTGSSEVQIAILTAKIKTLADFLQTRGKGDKHNKRNLRLLVHRRQKLLNYLKRRERGGPRWQHCIETLGLTEGTYKGEISL